MATPLTFGNPLKFGPYSYHKTKDKPTFLHRERERAPEALHKTYTFTSRGASNGPHAHASSKTKAHSSSGFFYYPKIEAGRRQKTTLIPFLVRKTHGKYNFCISYLTHTKTHTRTHTRTHIAEYK